MYNTKKLKSMVITKTEEITLLLSSFDRNVVASETDTKGIITYASKAFCKISGYTQEELIGKSHNTMRHPDMPDALFEELWQTIKTNKVWKGEIKNLKKDGDFYWSEIIISPEYNKVGTIVSYNAIRQDITAKKALEDLSANLESKVDERTKELEEVNKDISKSIDFASIIQQTFSTKTNEINNFFDDHFLFLKQKDLVGGDIIIFDEINEEECLLMVIDCTGHGVPGAFVTMIVKTLARQIIENIRSGKINVSPADILQIFNFEIKHLLDQWKQTSRSNVGFDGQILYYNKSTQKVIFSSARNDLWIYQNNHFTRIRGDRHSVGYRDSKLDFSFKEHQLSIDTDTSFYIYSDGYTDQLGGTKEIPFGHKNTLQVLEKNIGLSMAEQKSRLLDAVHSYKGKHEQNDDMCFVGLKLNKSNQ